VHSCFFYRKGDSSEATAEPSPSLMCCFCRFKTSWTHTQIEEKLDPFGFVFARKLGSQFASKDKTFISMARCVVLHDFSLHIVF
jgi:hypothetical protein